MEHPDVHPKEKHADPLQAVFSSALPNRLKDDRSSQTWSQVLDGAASLRGAAPSLRASSASYSDAKGVVYGDFTAPVREDGTSSALATSSTSSTTATTTAAQTESSSMTSKVMTGFAIFISIFVVIAAIVYIVFYIRTLKAKREVITMRDAGEVEMAVLRKEKSRLKKVRKQLDKHAPKQSVYPAQTAVIAPVAFAPAGVHVDEHGNEVQYVAVADCSQAQPMHEQTIYVPAQQEHVVVTQPVEYVAVPTYEAK